METIEVNSLETPHHAPLHSTEEITRYFKPVPNFYEVLEPYRHMTFVDCGTGIGDVPATMRDHGFKCIGVDRFKFQDQREGVLIDDALKLTYNSTCGVLLCRPSHGGWALSVARRALAQGAIVFYVGLRRNYAQDVGPITKFCVDKHVRVGLNFETMWVFKQS